MGRRCQRVNKSAHSDGDVGNHILTGNSDTRLRDNLKNNNVRRSKMSFSKVNLIPQEINQTVSRSCDIFPFWLPWILFPLTLLLRLLYVLEPTNWWILHPDEIFQSMEVAHSDAFGYGFRPYEYLPPPSHDLLNSTVISDSHAHAIKHGMFGLRSFLLPKLLAVVMIICDKFGSTASPFLVVKIFHVTMTSLLPVAIYKFTRSLHQSEDIACLSAILVCSSLTLNIFATHTLINSFLSFAFFLALIPLINTLKLIETSTSEVVDKANCSSIRESFGHSTNTNGVHHKKAINGEKAILQNERTSNISSQTIHRSGKNISNNDINLNIIDSNGKISNMREPKFNILSDSDNRETQAIQKRTNLKHLHNVVKISKEVMSGFGLALCIYIRVDLSVILFLILACNRVHNFGNISKFVMKSNKRYLTGLISGVVVGGFCDYFTYGKWFLSPHQWYKFNVLNSFAGNFFGVESFYFYLLKLYQNEPLACLSVVIVFIDIISEFRTHTTKPIRRAKNQNLIIFIFVVLAFSLSSHKELRFIHNAVIFMYISVSVAIFSVIKKLSQNQNSRQYSIYSVYIFIALFSSSHVYNFCNMKNADRAKWAYGKITESHETNMCLDFIRQQKDVSGVFMDRSVYMSGAYSILHHDVPIFALNIYEFMEYKSDKHMDASINLNLSQRKFKGFSTFKDISEFISIYNAQYLFRKIRETHIYNFLILLTNTNFNAVGYDEVFRIGNSKVMLRTFDKQKETEIQKETANAKIVLNATILEYEGSWLKHYGLYAKAEQRLMMANKVDPRRINTFRILLEMYSKLRHTDDYSSVLKACLQLYSRIECLEPYQPVELHFGYNGKP